MRRRLLSKMLQEQEERNRSQAILATLIPAVNLTRNEGAEFQAAPSSLPAGVPPQPAAPKRGWPKGKPRK